MKKWLLKGLMPVLFLYGCFEDDSNLDIRTLNPITIENLGESTRYSLFTGDTLKIEPLVYCQGIPDADLSFEWKLFGTGIVSTVLDSTMYLCAPVAAPPSAREYTLRFTVTDNTTGISRIETFSLSVLNPYGEGLLVADTKDDGIHTDLTLLMSKEFSDDIAKDNNKINIRRDIWSMNNGAPICGRVLAANVTTVYDNPSLTLLTEEKILRADPTDFTNIPGECDELLWSVVPEHIGHGYSSGSLCVYNGMKSEVMAANGYITVRQTQNKGRRYAYTLFPPVIYEPTVISDYNVSLMWSDLGDDRSAVYLYDALNHKMLFYNGSQLVHPEKEVNSRAPFDLWDLSAYEPFFIGRIANNEVAVLAKEKSTGAYKALAMSFADRTKDIVAKTIYDFSNGTNLTDAHSFALNKDGQVIYYATETDVYAMPIATTKRAEVQWSVVPGSGDKITGIKMYEWGGGSRYHENITEGGRSEKVSWPSRNRMMVVCTYNEMTKEGKVICVPITNILDGKMEPNRAFHTTFRGLGKVTGVYKKVK